MIFKVGCEQVQKVNDGLKFVSMFDLKTSGHNTPKIEHLLIRKMIVNLFNYLSDP